MAYSDIKDPSAHFQARTIQELVHQMSVTHTYW